MPSLSVDLSDRDGDTTVTTITVTVDELRGASLTRVRIETGAADTAHTFTVKQKRNHAANTAGTIQVRTRRRGQFTSVSVEIDGAPLLDLDML